MQRTLAILILVAGFVMSGCGGGQSYTLKCNIDTEEYGFEITGESGPVQVTSNGESQKTTYESGGVSAITVDVNRDVVYENSKNAYHIEGTIAIKPPTGEVTYDITATGDTFGDSPQTCKKP